VETGSLLAGARLAEIVETARVGELLGLQRTGEGLLMVMFFVLKHVQASVVRDRQQESSHLEHALHQMASQVQESREDFLLENTLDHLQRVVIGMTVKNKLAQPWPHSIPTRARR
jgi:hypothetical protein